MKTVLFIFVNLFVLTVGATLLAMRVRERRAKNRVARMLRGEEKPQQAPVDLLRESDESKLPRNGHRKKPRSIVHSLDQLLQLADIAWPVSRLLMLMGVLAAVGLALGALFPVLLDRAISMAAFAAGGAFVPYWYVKRAKNKRLDKMEQQLPDGMDFLARSMRAGHAFSISIGMVGDDLPLPLGREFRTLFNEQNLGAPMEVAFGNFTSRVPLMDARLFCSAAVLQRKTGGNLSELLNSLSEVIRDRFRLKGQVKAASAHAKLTAGILTAMPVLMVVAFMIMAPEYLQGLWADPDGKKLVGAAVISQLLGKYTIGRIVRIKV